MKATMFVASLFALVIASSVCFAQAPLMKAEVPFDFQVGDHHLRAGVYEVRMLNPKALALRNARGSAGAVVMTDTLETLENSTSTRFVFTRYGQTYFLSEIWTKGQATSRVLHRSKAEIELARRQIALSTIVLAKQ